MAEQAPFPASGAEIPSAPGPVPDNFWGGGGCGHMALAFKNMWPDLRIGVDVDNKDGTVNHAWVHDGQRAHDYEGTHGYPDAPSGGWNNATTHMDMPPEKLAELMRIRWSPGEPWDDPTVHEAAEIIEKHWLGSRGGDDVND